MWLVTLCSIVGTVAAYVAMCRLHRRYPHPLLNVIVLSALLVIAGLCACGLDVVDYKPASKIMTSLLGAATVSLALPLYRYRQLLLRNIVPICVSVGAGALASMLVACGICRLGGLDTKTIMSIMTKGVTIPFAVDISAFYGGDPAVAIAFVVFTGTLGTMVGCTTLTLWRLKRPFARGLALGTVFHAAGIAAAVQEGEETGAMAGLAMILAGIMTTALAPLVVWLVG